MSVYTIPEFGTGASRNLEKLVMQNLKESLSTKLRKFIGQNQEDIQFGCNHFYYAIKL